MSVAICGGRLFRYAEVAFAVLDEYQGHGIGTLLLRHLTSLVLQKSEYSLVAWIYWSGRQNGCRVDVGAGVARRTFNACPRSGRFDEAGRSFTRTPTQHDHLGLTLMPTAGLPDGRAQAPSQ